MYLWQKLGIGYFRKLFAGLMKVTPYRKRSQEQWWKTGMKREKQREEARVERKVRKQSTHHTQTRERSWRNLMGHRVNRCEFAALLNKLYFCSSHQEQLLPPKDRISINHLPVQDFQKAQRDFLPTAYISHLTKPLWAEWH